MFESESDRRSILTALGGVEYTTPTGPLLAVFENEFFEASETEARNPTLTCTTEDAERVTADRKGTTITVCGVIYRIRRHEPDGTGMSRIPLVAA